MTDIHVHIQPWEQMKDSVTAAMRRGHEDHFEFLLALMKSPELLISHLDKAGVWRVGLINYPSPDLMGFTHETNEFAARYAAHDRRRLIPFGGVHPRFTKDPEGDVDRLIALGIACLKIHPCHQVFPANAHTEGLDALGRIYARAQEHDLPVMVHTGTSVFPGARSKYGHPIELDDVAVDFPRLRIIMAHGGRPLWMNEAFFVMRRHRQIRMDISGIPPKHLLDYFPRFSEIADRALWGTDWPSPGVRDLGKNLDQFRALPLDENLKHAVTVENALEVFPAKDDDTNRA